MAHLTPLPRELQGIIIAYLHRMTFHMVAISNDIHRVRELRLELSDGVWEPMPPVKEMVDFLNYGHWRCD